MMALVTVSTIYQTVLIAYLVLLSKGWKIARQSLARADLSKLTLIFAAVYLIYSGYYVSVNVPQLGNFAEVSQALTPKAVIFSLCSTSCTFTSLW